MTASRNSTSPSNGGFQLPPWLVIVLITVVGGLSWWTNSQPEIKRPNQTSREPASEVVQPDQKPGQAESHLQTNETDEPSQIIEHQTIRDLHGKVVFEGAVNLKPTLDRIARGESDRHRNDGTVFQNREGRLPRKPHSYYKEYVHPTPGELGPGPQRVIVGQDGDIWYTPDHYQTFVEIKKP